MNAYQSSGCGRLLPNCRAEYGRRHEVEQVSNHKTLMQKNLKVVWYHSALWHQS